jgi:DNA-binding response OmpR family regulator
MLTASTVEILTIKGLNGEVSGLLNKEQGVVMACHEKYVLVVDRDEVARLLVSYILEVRGYGVRAVHDFREARREMKRHRYDAVLMNSPARGSTAIILRRDPSGVLCEPAPALSHESDEGDDSANAWQPVAWLPKPYEAALLLCALRAVLHEPLLRPPFFAGR